MPIHLSRRKDRRQGIELLAFLEAATLNAPPPPRIAYATIPGVDYGWQLTDTGVTAPGVTGVIARGGARAGGYTDRTQLPLHVGGFTADTTYRFERINITTSRDLQALANVTLDRCWIVWMSGTPNPAFLVFGSGARVRDCDFTNVGGVVGSANGTPSSALKFTGSNNRVDRCLILAGSGGVESPGTVTVSDSFIRINTNSFTTNGAQHKDATFRLQGPAGVIYSRCWIETNVSGTTTGAIFLQDIDNTINRTTYQDTMLDGIGYLITLSTTNAARGLKNLVFRNVRGDTSHGAYGVVGNAAGTDYGPATSTFDEWSQVNVWAAAGGDTSPANHGGHKGSSVPRPTSNSTGPVLTLTGGTHFPSAPQILGAQVVNTSADVTFNAPLFTGGSAITGYRATATPVGGGTAITQTGVSSPITLTVVAGVDYEFSVAATNVNGYGSESAVYTLESQGGGSQNVSETWTIGEAASVDSGNDKLATDSLVLTERVILLDRRVLEAVVFTDNAAANDPGQTIQYGWQLTRPTSNFDVTPETGLYATWLRGEFDAYQRSTFIDSLNALPVRSGPFNHGETITLRRITGVCAALQSGSWVGLQNSLLDRCWFYTAGSMANDPLLILGNNSIVQDSFFDGGRSYDVSGNVPHEAIRSFTGATGSQVLRCYVYDCAELIWLEGGALVQDTLGINRRGQGGIHADGYTRRAGTAQVDIVRSRIYTWVPGMTTSPCFLKTTGGNISNTALYDTLLEGPGTDATGSINVHADAGLSNLNVRVNNVRINQVDGNWSGMATATGSGTKDIIEWVNVHRYDAADPIVPANNGGAKGAVINQPGGT